MKPTKYCTQPGHKLETLKQSCAPFVYKIFPQYYAALNIDVFPCDT